LSTPCGADRVGALPPFACGEIPPEYFYQEEV